MLRLLILPFLCLYLFAASGLQVQLHYCGSELASWSLYASQPGGCEDGECEEEPYNPDPCCSNESIEAGLINTLYTHSWEAGEKGDRIQKAPTDKPEGYALWMVLSSPPIARIRAISYPPDPDPGCGHPALYALYHQFLFYG